MMASFLQYTLPGSPSLYYGDEAGLEGHKDPFNRRTYPWGRESQTLLSHFRRLGQLRKDCAALRLGDIQFIESIDHHIAFRRSYQGKSFRIYVNQHMDCWEIPAGQVRMGHNIQTMAPDWLSLLPMGYCIVEDA